MRRADADADGAWMDGMNSMDAAGVNGESTDVDGANGGSRGGGMNVDGARGANADSVRGVGARGAWGANAGTEGASMG